jgi:hypothetical protein
MCEGEEQVSGILVGIRHRLDDDGAVRTRLEV